MEAEGWLPQLNECAAQDDADRGNWKTHLLPLIKIKRERETSSFLSLRWGPGRRIRGFTHFLSAPGAFTPQNSTNSATFFSLHLSPMCLYSFSHCNDRQTVLSSATHCLVKEKMAQAPNWQTRTRTIAQIVAVGCQNVRTICCCCVSNCGHHRWLH